MEVIRSGMFSGFRRAQSEYGLPDNGVSSEDFDLIVIASGYFAQQSVACRSQMISSPSLQTLYQEEMVREPTLRETIHWGGEEFFQAIGESIRRVEALFIFMTGVRPNVQCDYCLQGYGVFPVCIVSHQPGVPNDCANCWWAGRTDTSSVRSTTLWSFGQRTHSIIFELPA
ncbi:hypothetical protein N7465_000379 [Penicillium sp. CMV-2018d]|nr:hypothetical protein N7465_000379 [Penicillium sp. CMV-2018d]